MFRLLKLKPPHGWNAVAWELAIVTLGVIIALGAQQIVTSLNDQRDADIALRNIRQELGSNLGFIKRRLELNPCVQRRLEEIATYLDAVEAGGQPTPPRFIGHPPYPEFTNHRLEAAQSAGSMTHMSADDQALVADAYQPLAELKREFDDEQIAWAELRALADRPRPSAAELANARIALQHARLYYFISDADAHLAAEAAQRLGVKARPVIFRPSAATCLPMTTSFEEASRRNQSKFGETR